MLSMVISLLIYPLW